MGIRSAGDGTLWNAELYGRSVVPLPLKWNGSGGFVSPPSILAGQSPRQKLSSTFGRSASQPAQIMISGCAAAFALLSEIFNNSVGLNLSIQTSGKCKYPSPLMDFCRRPVRNMAMLPGHYQLLNVSGTHSARPWSPNNSFKSGEL